MCPQPLAPIEHNGPGLEYKVSYRRQDMEEDWHEHMVKRHSFVVKNTPTFVPYEIKIQAKNHQGWGPEPKIVTGYSGEDCMYLYLLLPVFECTYSVGFIEPGLGLQTGLEATLKKRFSRLFGLVTV